MRTNYHTHTPRCLHARGTELELCQCAVERGFDTLGFADHCAWPYENGFVSTFRMVPDQIGGYVKAVRAAGKAFEGRLKVFLGWECEYYPAYLSWLKEEKERIGLDYLILGNHYDTTDDGGVYFGDPITKHDVRRYVETCTKGLETGLFCCFAHPDLYLRCLTAYDSDCRDAARELCRTAKALNIPLEYNLLGFRNCKDRPENQLGYPCAAFWETAAEEGVTCIIGCDAHAPKDISDALWDMAALYLDSLGLSRVTRLSFDKQ